MLAAIDCWMQMRRLYSAGVEVILSEVEKAAFNWMMMPRISTHRWKRCSPNDSRKGKKIHSGRSRNDQVLLDIKLYLKEEIQQIKEEILQLFDQSAVAQRETQGGVTTWIHTPSNCHALLLRLWFEPMPRPWWMTCIHWQLPESRRPKPTGFSCRLW